MAHFAELDENNKVLRVVVVNNEVTTTDDVENEQDGIDFLDDLYPDSGTWVQTSYNKSMRGRMADIGGTYDPVKDRFIQAQPYPSWNFNSITEGWDPPIPFPDDTPHVHWNEETTSWVANPKGDQPHPSWVWSDEHWWWEPPVDPPEDFFDDPSKYEWNEEEQKWDEV